MLYLSCFVLIHIYHNVWLVGRFIYMSFLLSPRLWESLGFPNFQILLTQSQCSLEGKLQLSLLSNHFRPITMLFCSVCPVADAISTKCLVCKHHNFATGTLPLYTCLFLFYSYLPRLCQCGRPMFVDAFCSPFSASSIYAHILLVISIKSFCLILT